MKINFLEKILPPKNDVFFEHFIEAAENCKIMAKLFNGAIKEGPSEELMIKARMTKRKGNRIERDLISLLNSTFITPIEREDIQCLAIIINKIDKKIARACKNLTLYNISEVTPEMIEQSKLILAATDELVKIVTLMKKIHKTKEITDARDEMKTIETMGDDINNLAVEKLFSGEFDAIEIIKLRDIYRDIESALDNCYTVADQILSIALKNN